MSSSILPWCKHKWGNVTEDNRQYCTECNIARTVECSHKFKTIKELTVYHRGRITGEKIITQYVYILQCSTCGEIKEKRINRWD